MKKLFLLLLIIIGNFIFSQDIPQFKLTPHGFEPIVILVDGKSVNEIYQKSLNWVQETYKNPDKVLKANILNEKIRIEGFKSNAWFTTQLGMTLNYGIDYTLEISFKDGKYKEEFIIGRFYTTNNSLALFDYTSFFKESGEIRKSYSKAVPSLELTANNLSQSLYDYISGKTQKANNDW